MMFEKFGSQMETAEIPQIEKQMVKRDCIDVPSMDDLRGLLKEAFPCKITDNTERSLGKADGPDMAETETPSAKEFTDLSTMKRELGKNYGEIKDDKPSNSPNIAKWFENKGTICIEEKDDNQAWTYTDAEGKTVQYIDGKVKFPLEAKHPVIDDISIGKFTGERNLDKQLYLERLEEEYGLTEIPDGYALHHDTENGNMQLIRIDYHKEFTHAGGHSMYKEED